MRRTWLAGSGAVLPLCLSWNAPPAAAAELQARADQLARAAQVSGVPTLIVDGRYRVEIDTSGDLAGQLAVVDALVAKARAERGLAAPP